MDLKNIFHIFNVVYFFGGVFLYRAKILFGYCYCTILGGVFTVLVKYMVPVSILYTHRDRLNLS